jgi:hypothetical protein
MGADFSLSIMQLPPDQLLLRWVNYHLAQGESE